jgi:pimeloyl-ACP methyl ester carboxylesterase
MAARDAFAYLGTMDREVAEPDRKAARLNYARHGDGEPLLLLHSLGGSLMQWNPVMEALAAHREVIAVDMPGFGDSQALPAGTEPTAANLAAAVLDFYRSLGIDRRPHVAGISLGGWAAIECGRQGAVRSVVALCPPGFWKETPGGSNGGTTRARQGGRALGPLVRPIMWTARGRRWALGRFFRHPERLSAAEASAVARAYVTAPAYPEASVLMRAGRVADLTEIKVPVTIGWAEYDTLVRNRPLPEDVLPEDVRQIELPGCGHVPTWDDPELVARIVLEGTVGG